MSASPSPSREVVDSTDYEGWLKALNSNLGGAAALAIVFASGALIRFLCIGWDGFSGLHPDERHMVFAVSSSLEAIHKSFVEGRVWPLAWFSLEENPFNPRRAGFFYVYGDLLHNMTTAAAYYLRIDGWPQRIMLGRIIVASFDSFAILIVFFSARYCRLNVIGCAAAALLYAVMPLTLQHAGFFVVDGLGTFFTATFLFALSGWLDDSRRSWMLLAGFALAAALACKISFLALIALLPLAVVLKIVRSNNRRQAIYNSLLDTASLAAVACVSFRILNPSAFLGPGFFDISLSNEWVRQLRELSSIMANPDGVPSAWQWTVPGVHLAAFWDLGLWCFGVPTLILVAAGVVSIDLREQQSPNDGLIVTVAFSILIAILLATQAVPAVRYALPVTPALAILGGAGFAFLTKTRARPHRHFTTAAFALLVAAIGWGGAVAQLHILPNTRISASVWLEKNLPHGAVIAKETDWDDALPVRLVRQSDYAMVGGFTDNGFQSVNIGLTDPDLPEKAARIAAALAKSDVLVMSSDRQLRTMTALSTRFPITTTYFEALFRGDLCFSQVAKFERLFNVFGFDLDDSRSQEIWRVYDHPPVWIFSKEPCFDETKVRIRLESVMK